MEGPTLRGPLLSSPGTGRLAARCLCSVMHCSVWRRRHRGAQATGVLSSTVVPAVILVSLPGAYHMRHAALVLACEVTGASQLPLACCVLCASLHLDLHAFYNLSPVKLC